MATKPIENKTIPIELSKEEIDIFRLQFLEKGVDGSWFYRLEKEKNIKVCEIFKEMVERFEKSDCAPGELSEIELFILTCLVGSALKSTRIYGPWDKTEPRQI